MFCINIITRPIPNSTADRTKKKKVRESKLELSYIKPIDNTTIYKVIHRSSAVNNKWREFDMLFVILKNIKKKTI